MAERQPRYSMEEFARRGQEIYEQKIRPFVEAEHKGEFLVIDIETGEYEMDLDSMAATARLWARLPDAQPWGLRIGYATSRIFGGHFLRKV